MNKAEKLMDSLAMAFGGKSQVPDFVVGMAIAGQCNNGHFSYKDALDRREFLENVMEAICDQWEDVDIDFDTLLSSIANGIKMQCEGWGETGNDIVNDLLTDQSKCEDGSCIEDEEDEEFNGYSTGTIKNNPFKKLEVLI